jgi:hypothetical protein
MAPRAGFLAKLAEPAFEWAAVRYKAAVGAELKKYGLRYDDLLDPTMNLVRNPARQRTSLKAAMCACLSGHGSNSASLGGLCLTGRLGSPLVGWYEEGWAVSNVRCDGLDHCCCSGVQAVSRQ